MSEIKTENDLSEESVETAAETPKQEAEPAPEQVTEKKDKQNSEETHTYGELIKGFIKWLIIAVIIGVIVGLVGTFLIGSAIILWLGAFCNQYPGHVPVILCLLAGIVITALSAVRLYT